MTKLRVTRTISEADSDTNLFTRFRVNAEWWFEQVVQSFGDIDVQSWVGVLEKDIK